ncbi:MAG: sigma-70 family RNA polymerase sigma factor [Proteobacteria bacterium]|nr:sigma-70 family RNA polymerase sigma factor [Pseudomonadota bacterium]
MSAPAELTDLLLASGRGDRPAFERLYRLSSPRLYSLARWLLKRDALAEEIMQEAYVQIWRDAARFDPARASAMTWMAVIVRHCALDELRRKRPELEPGGGSAGSDEDDAMPEPGVAEADPDAGPLELALADGDRRQLGICLETLSEMQRQSILLAFLRGLTHSEVASALAAPLGSVKSWVRRGLEQLKRCLTS